MTTLLHLDSSPSPTSVTRELTREFARAWQIAHPDGRIIYRDIATNPPKPVDAQWIGAVYTPEAQRSLEQKESLTLSDELISELEQANEYVFGVAMHNFSIPSVLKLWIDQIARNGRTFSYGQQGPKGLLQGKKATVVIASGGMYDTGSAAAAMNHLDPYMKTVLTFLGVTDVKFVAAGGAAQVFTGAVDRRTFLEPKLQEVRSAAA